MSIFWGTKLWNLILERFNIVLVNIYVFLCVYIHVFIEYACMCINQYEADYLDFLCLWNICTFDMKFVSV